MRVRVGYGKIPPAVYPCSTLAIKSGGIFVGHIIVVGGVSGSVGIDSWWRGQRCGVVNGR